MINPTAAHRITDAMDLPRQPQPLMTEALSAALEVAAIESRWRAGLAQRRIAGWKRALDLTLIALTCPIWLPLMLFIMVVIKISSPGPVFYRQERVGLRGRLFMIYKFRSMKLHAQTSGHELHFERLMRRATPMTKLDAADSRIIPWGRVLRAMGLDELPQIFNVLRGEMSLSGPRPGTRIEFEKYEEWQRERVNVPPGITGYWQVNGKNRTTFQQMIEMDLLYARNATLGLDLWIMLMTPVALAAQVLELMRPRVAKRASQDASPPVLVAPQIGERAG